MLAAVGAAGLVVFVGWAVFQGAAVPSGGVEDGRLTVDPDSVYDPVKAGEALPSGYRALLDRDQIEPVYNPKFVEADETEWDDETLVIGVSIGEEAKAYPVSHLNRREIVIDRIEGIPILVTW